MPTRRYVVSANDDALPRLGALADRLREAGLTVTEQLDAIGILIGFADDEAVEALRRVDGVLAVEADRRIEPLPGNEPPTRSE